MTDTARALAELATLEPDWDGEGSDPPSAELIETARQFIEAAGEPVAWLVPVSGGGIMLALARDGQEVQVDLSSAGVFGCLWRNEFERYREADDLDQAAMLAVVRDVFGTKKARNRLSRVRAFAYLMASQLKTVGAESKGRTEPPHLQSPSA